MFSNLTNFAHQFARVVIQVGKLSSGPPKVSFRRLPGFSSPTTFSLFVQDFGNENENPSGTTLIVEAAAKWKTLDEETINRYKQKSKELADEKKAEYDKLSDEEKETLHEEFSKALSEKEARRKRKSGREFVTDYRAEHPPAASTMADNTKIVMEASKMWNAMTEEEKEVLKAKLEPAKTAYLKDMAAWKEEDKAKKREQKLKEKEEKKKKQDTTKDEDDEDEDETQ